MFYYNPIADVDNGGALMGQRRDKSVHNAEKLFL